MEVANRACRTGMVWWRRCALVAQCVGPSLTEPVSGAVPCHFAGVLVAVAEDSRLIALWASAHFLNECHFVYCSLLSGRFDAAPSFTGSDRVNGSGGALCVTALRGAYRRVSQSRICTTVLRLARTPQWGWGFQRLMTASANQMIAHLNHNRIA